MARVRQQAAQRSGGIWPLLRSRRHTRRIAALVVCVGLAVAGDSVPAAAQSNELRVVVDELERLRRDLTDIQRQVYGADFAPAERQPETNTRGAETEVRITELDEQLRRLTGLIEELEHRIDTVDGRLDKLVADVDFRLSALEQAAAERPVTGTDAGGGTAAIGEGGTKIEAAEEPVDRLPDGTPMEQYDYAIGLLRRGDFADAEQAFSAFVGAYPDDPLVGNAQYWLGETHYVRNQYELAATAFLDGYQRYPDSSKAPDNLLKLGMTLSSLGQRAEACATLDELATKFPDAAVQIHDRAVRERATLHCP